MSVEYITDAAVPLCLIPASFRHPLAQQFEEIDEDGDLIRSYDGNEAEILGYSKILMSKIGSALAEQHEGLSDEEDDEED